jgi:hypothetical protein
MALHGKATPCGAPPTLQTRFPDIDAHGKKVQQSQIICTQKNSAVEYAKLVRIIAQQCE